jgi:hypothetical protein
MGNLLNSENSKVLVCVLHNLKRMSFTIQLGVESLVPPISVCIQAECDHKGEALGEVKGYLGTLFTLRHSAISIKIHSLYCRGIRSLHFESLLAPNHLNSLSHHLLSQLLRYSSIQASVNTCVLWWNSSIYPHLRFFRHRAPVSHLV